MKQPAWAVADMLELELDTFPAILREFYVAVEVSYILEYDSLGFNDTFHIIHLIFFFSYCKPTVIQ